MKEIWPHIACPCMGNAPGAVAKSRSCGNLSSGPITSPDPAQDCASLRAESRRDFQPTIFHLDLGESYVEVLTDDGLCKKLRPCTAANGTYR